MVTPPLDPPNDGETADSSVSWFHKTVTLRDWWLIKPDAGAQGKRLAVAGFSFSENKSRRFFNSAPIAKRFDEFTLETADRIVVLLQGLINEARTIENGFSSEIIDRFLFGFPSCWEEHADDCLEEVIDPGAGVNHARDASGLNESTTDPDDACPTFTSSEPKGTNQDVTVVVADDSNLNNSTLDLSVQEGYSLDHDFEGLAVFPIPRDRNVSRPLDCSSTGAVTGIAEQVFLMDIDFSQFTSCHSDAVNLSKEAVVFPTEPSSKIVGESSHKTDHHKKSGKQKQSADQISNIKQSTDAHGIDFPQFTSCHSDAVNLSKEAVVFPTEPSSKIVGESSHKTVHHKKSGKQKQSVDQISNIKQSTDAHGIAICGSLLDQHMSLRDSAIHDLNVPDSEGMTATGISRGASIRKIGEVNEKNGDEISSDPSLPKDPKGVTSQKDDLLGPPSIGNMYILEQMGKSKNDMIVDTTKSGLEVDVSCTSNMKGDNLVSTDTDCGKRECAKNLKHGKVQKLRLRSPPAGKSNPMKQNAIYLNGISVVANLPASACGKVAPEVTHSVLRNLKDGKKQHSSSKVYMNQKDKKSLSEPNKRLSHGKRKRDSSTSQRSPTEVNLVEAMLRAGRTLRHSSTHTKSQDKNGQAADKGSSVRKKAKRKIEFDVDVTPKKHMIEKKTCVYSTDSLTFKRSRSGRLLLPTLQFWRNQIPVYDAERNFTGIQEEVDA